MDVAQFDFELPEECIALRPAVPRDSARMLVVHQDGRLEHSHVGRLPEFLRAGDGIVLNNSKVIRARLKAVRIGRGESQPKIELLLHKRTDACSFAAFARRIKRSARPNPSSRNTRWNVPCCSNG